MIRLVYSNHTESLLDALVESLREHRSNPLDTLDVVVPNRHLEAYLRTGIAQRVGIATGIRFRRLEEAIAESMESPTGGPAGVLVEHWELFGAVLGTLLGNASHVDPELSPVRSYLDSVDDPDGRDLRAVQLAQRVTHLYEEYILHRPEMLRKWRQGSRGIPSGGNLSGDGRGKGDDEEEETYRWQASLFQHAIQSLQKSKDPVRLCLDDLVQEPHRRRLRRTAPLFVFGLSYVAPLYQRLFAILAQHCALQLFTLNPCCEFWEDIETDREIRRRLAPSHRDLRVGPEALSQSEDPFGLLEDDDNLALRRWGIPGRESIRLLNEVSDCDFEAHFEVPEGTGVLPSLQRDILFRQPRSATASTIGEDHESGLRTDQTLRFVAVSDPRREAQVVVDEIWRSLRADDDRRSEGRSEGRSDQSEVEPLLRLHQIAIIVNRASVADYLPHLEAAALETGLPLAISDQPVRAIDHAVEAALLLLELPFGDLGRPEMLRFMTHPAVIGSDDGVDPEGWADLAEELGIILGADQQSFAETYVDLDLLSWDQGIRRLVLGATLDPYQANSTEDPDASSVQPFSWQGEQYLPAPGSGYADPARLRFGLLARSLIRDVAEIRRGRHRLSEWSQRFRRLMRGYLRDDDGSLEPVFRALEPLDSMDPTGIEVAARVATEIARGTLSGLSSQRGNPLADGVIVGSFLPMRAIPFRRVYVLGMGEGLFPAAQRRDTLDLRSRNRRSGDVSPEERDRYAFLETLLCTREHLSLSWTARDPLTGEVLRPSSVVRELMEIIDDRWGEGSSEQVVRRPPDGRESPYPPLFLSEVSPQEADEPLSPPARAEAEARSQGEALRESLGPAAPVVYLEALQRGDELHSGTAISHLLSLAPISPDILPLPPTQLRNRHLREFLRCPLQAWGEVVAGLRRDDADDVELRAEEHFKTPPLEIVVARRQAFLEALVTANDPMEELSRTLHLAELAGRSTVGTLLDLELEANQTIFDDWSSVATSVISPVPDLIRRVVYGPRHRHDGSATCYPSIVLEVSVPVDSSSSGGETSKVSIEFSGTTQTLLGTSGTVLILDHKKLDRIRALDKLLSAWIDHLALALLEGVAKEPRLVAVCGTGGKRFDFELAPIEGAAARGILCDLATDLLTNSHDDLLPCDAIFKASGSPCSLEALTSSTLVQAIRNSVNSSDCACRWGSVPSSLNYPPAEASSALDRVRRRFGPLFAHLSELEP